MKIYPEELKAFEKYRQETPFHYFSEEQKKLIRSEIKLLAGWQLEHPYLHNAISILIICSLVFLDLYSLSYLSLNDQASISGVVALTIGHGLLMYNIIGYTLHEGAYHRLLIISKGPVTNMLATVSENICRFWYCDPVYYRGNHHGHHIYLGTKKDGTFTNMIHPKRFFLSMGPLASALNYNDYKLHTGDVFTKSKIISESLSFGLVILIGLPLLLNPGVGLLQYIAVVFFGTWISFILDRIRESTEHNLMPDDSFHGAKEFGVNFGGLLFGGGPWGQPCHLSHHIAPGLPWYQQLRLHFALMKIMTKEQKDQFVVNPFWGVITLLKNNLKTNHRYIKAVKDD